MKKLIIIAVLISGGLMTALADSTRTSLRTLPMIGTNENQMAYPGDKLFAGNRVSPRFVKMGANSIFDMATGLVWVNDIVAAGWTNRVSAAFASAFCNVALPAMGYDGVPAGTTGPGAWRLPSMKELLSINRYDSLDADGHEIALITIHPEFTDNYLIYDTGFWSSNMLDGRTYAVYTDDGTVYNEPVEYTHLFRPCRTLSAFGCLWLNQYESFTRTNQVRTTRTIPRGWNALEQPSKNRFVDNDDGTVTDTATQLQWVKNRTLSGSAGQWTWSNAFGHVDTLVFASRSDWRLPNINEQMTLFVEGTNVGFPDMNESAGETFWTYNRGSYYYVKNNGIVVEDSANSSNSVRPVRSVLGTRY